MKYYKVKPEHDNRRKPSKTGYEIYIGNELYTEKEVERQGLNKDYLQEIEIPKTQIYWFFGARKQFTKN